MAGRRYGDGWLPRLSGRHYTDNNPPTTDTRQQHAHEHRDISRSLQYQLRAVSRGRIAPDRGPI
jgi:hypothetical protein